MKLPEYWSKASAEDVDCQGNRVSFSCWRSSDHSVEEAQASALEAAKRVLQAFLSGNRAERYAYSDRPLREEIVEKFAGGQGEIVAAVTRSAFGALVLNTDRVAFIDIDFPPIQPLEAIAYFFRRLFNKSARSPEYQREYDGVQAMMRLLDGKPQWSIRLYRTCAGMRAIITHDVFDPTSESTLAMLRSANCDPLYVQLCKSQQCFRARLTPKPWRCGQNATPPRWPIEGQENQARLAEWLAEYAAKHARYATCRFLGTLGSGAIHPAVAQVLELHDRTTRCEEPLELA